MPPYLTDSAWIQPSERTRFYFHWLMAWHFVSFRIKLIFWPCFWRTTCIKYYIGQDVQRTFSRHPPQNSQYLGRFWWLGPGVLEKLQLIVGCGTNNSLERDRDYRLQDNSLRGCYPWWKLWTDRLTVTVYRCPSDHENVYNASSRV